MIVYVSPFGRESDRQLNDEYLARGFSYMTDRADGFLLRYPEASGVEFHQPLGFNPVEKMDFDWPVEAEQSDDWRIRAINREFVGSVIRYGLLHRDKQVRVYTGTPLGDKDMIDREDDLPKFNWRAEASLDFADEIFDALGGQFVLDIDAAHRIPEDHPIVPQILKRHERGMKIGIEGGRSFSPWMEKYSWYWDLLLLPHFAEKGRVEGWHGRQIAIAKHGRFKDMPEGWRQDMEARGFTVCAY